METWKAEWSHTEPGVNHQALCKLSVRLKLHYTVHHLESSTYNCFTSEARSPPPRFLSLLSPFSSSQVISSMLADIAHLLWMPQMRSLESPCDCFCPLLSLLPDKSSQLQSAKKACSCACTMGNEMRAESYWHWSILLNWGGVLTVQS